MKQYKTQ